MCGIVALWNRDGRPIDLVAFEAAVRSLRHRGPDDEGYVLVDTTSGRTVECGGSETETATKRPRLAELRGERFDLALGHRRLAIVDLSAAGHQPMRSARSDRWLVFNGMIHNFVELRQELAGRGHVFRSATDTEVILAAYDEWGEEGLRRLNGMWAFVLWDHRAHRLFASRDRFGIKPLLLYDDGRTAAVASELKAIARLPDMPRDLDAEALHHYLSLMKVPAPHTIVRGIRKVMPAHSVTVTRQTATANCYWTPALAPTDAITASDAVDEVDALLRDSIRLRLQADVPVGTLLSGGIDSGLVTAVAAQESGTVLETYSAGFPALRSDESPWARQVAAHVRTRHHPLTIGAELLDVLPAMVALFDEPFAVSSVMGIYALAREAARDVKVVLTGDGGDELFAGYVRRYLRVEQIWRRTARRPLARFRPARVRAATARVRWETPSIWSRGVAFANVARSERRRRDDAFNLMRMIFNEPEKAALYTPEWRARTRGSNTLRTLGATLPAETDEPLRWQLHDIRTALHDEMLSKVDKATSAWGIEARVPFLDHRLVERALSLPARLTVVDGQGKWILRKIAARYLPTAVVEREKRGFTIPLSAWYANEWRSLLHDVLAPTAVRRAGVFRPETVAQVIAFHDAHPSFHTAHMVFTLLCFQLWHDGRTGLTG